MKTSVRFPVVEHSSSVRAVTSELLGQVKRMRWIVERVVDFFLQLDGEGVGLRGCHNRPVLMTGGQMVDHRHDDIANLNDALLMAVWRR